MEEGEGSGAGESQGRSRGNSTSADPELDKDCLMKYVKIKTRHITDGQVRTRGRRPVE